jgi:DNA-binding IclR family transcriptional regulator
MGKVTGRMTDNTVQPRVYSVAAVDRALDLLDAMLSLGPSSLTHLAEATGCTRSLAFRMLRTLERRGYSRQDGPRGRWQLGYRMTMLGRVAAMQGALTAEAEPVLASLAKISGENTYLMTREGITSRIEAVCKADPVLLQYDEVGSLGQLHAGPGRLLLAFAPAAIQKLVLSQRLPRLGPQTRTDPGKIAADLPRIRSRGYLLTSHEISETGISIAAPVRDQTGEVIAALYIVSSSFRMPLAKAQTLLPTVMAHSASLSRRLGLNDRSA